MNGALPQGRRGQLTAVGLLLMAACLAWLAVASPLFDWYAQRAERLAERRMMLSHMAQLVAALPALRRDAGQADAGTTRADALLGGETDAIAGATLQGAVQDMAAAAGATLASAEALPGEQQGAFRRIGLRVAVSGDWPVLVSMLRAVDDGQLRLLVDDLQLHMTAQVRNAGPAPIEASFVVLGFRPGKERPAGPDLRAESGATP